MKRIMAKSLCGLSVVAAMMFGSCAQGDRFSVRGNITEAADSMLYLENISLDGPIAIDSVKLGKDGAFEFSETRQVLTMDAAKPGEYKSEATDAPEFYRLRIAGQIINLAVDSTETITVKASYPTMSSQYEVEGSAECSKIKALVLAQMQLQLQVKAIAENPTLGNEATGDSIVRVVEAYKQNVKMNYIFKQPMKSSSYFALFQTLGSSLLFDPQDSKEDVKVFAAVATSWDTYHPGALRGVNLHNIAVEGMKTRNIVRNKENAGQAVAVREVSTIGISLTDNHGAVRSLAELKGKVVLLDFHLFGMEGSADRIMQLREVYNKYHDRGLEIYQVAYDGNAHFWKQQVAALPWICVLDEDGTSSDNLMRYNVQTLPTFFLLDKEGSPVKRDAQIQDLDAEIQKLL